LLMRGPAPMRVIVMDNFLCSFALPRPTEARTTNALACLKLIRNPAGVAQDRSWE